MNSFAWDDNLLRELSDLMKDQLKRQFARKTTEGKGPSGQKRKRGWYPASDCVRVHQQALGRPAGEVPMAGRSLDREDLLAARTARCFTVPCSTPRELR